MNRRAHAIGHHGNAGDGEGKIVPDVAWSYLTMVQDSLTHG